ncbi:MAG: hypothetical protein GY835_18125 [bacterium]|nr:hypothetical protein [bacterium]
MAYKKEFPGGNAPQALVTLLERLAREEYASKVYAATSLGMLRLTTAPDFSVEDRHGSVGVRTYDKHFVVAYIEAGKHKATVSRVCSEEDLMDVVGLYLLRLLLE